MNNRNPAQRSMVPPAPVPTPTQTPTYLNVFTVEEFESNGKSGKRWTKIGAADNKRQATCERGVLWFS
jgi:hypothetical protein